MRNYKLFSKPFIYLLCLYLITCALLRIILLFSPIVSGHFSVGVIFKIFFLGALSNAFLFIQASFLLWVFLLFISDTKYKRPYGVLIFCGWLVLFIYVTFFKTILNQYGSVLPLLGSLLTGWKTLSFGLMLFFPKYRYPLRVGIFSFWIFVFVTAILLNALSEYYFFLEFGVRYNFIAVDYLIYTNEVIGNITESYPVVPLFSILGLISIGLTWFIVKHTKSCLLHLPDVRQKLVLAGGIITLILAGWLIIPCLASLERNSNVFANEIQADGIYKFYTAYTDNKLNYFKFYPTISHQEAFGLLSQFMPGIKDSSTARQITSGDKEIHKNVMLITVESLSADYMAHFGNKDTLTPFLDSLADQSLFFTDLFATGNRTVRGLEAVTLSLPPMPGESIIKQADNKQKFGTGYLFKDRGYAVRFLYGGFSYFDNMRDFYEGNGYQIVDRNNLNKNEITFANIWGVCDGDMADEAIRVMNSEYAKGKLFFNHWMTVSNHRPFTYPNGKIDIPGDSKSRKGGVKYTDYALGHFFKMAEQEPWFDNTIFIIVADHCASSAGKTVLPMDKYRIPAIVYSKGFIQPRKDSVLMSQIDLMPTVLGLMHFNYTSKFYGTDVLQPDYKPRAFIATYQNLGYIRDSMLTILSPVKQVAQYKLVPIPEKGVQPMFQEQYNEVLEKSPRPDLVNEAIAFYQSASWLLEHKEYQK